MSELSILTFNIRRDRGDDGVNNWDQRRALVAAMLVRHHPDVVVFQEVLVGQLRDLISMLPQYEWVGVGRDDGAEAGEFAPIFYRGLSATRSGTFWFSDTPEVPSRSWPGMTRICTWVELGDPERFAVFNVHLEYEFESTQLQSIQLLRTRLGSRPTDYPILLAGDFNFTPGSPPYLALSDFMNDSFDSVPPAPGHRARNDAATNHGFTGRVVTTEPGASRIDYVWHRGALDVRDLQIVTDGSDDPSGVFISDHWPVECRFAVPPTRRVGSPCL